MHINHTFNIVIIIIVDLNYIQNSQKVYLINLIKIKKID